MAASRPATAWSAFKLGAVGVLILTALTTLLTWTAKDGVGSWGLAHDDGFVVVLACIVGVAMIAYGVKAAWIAPGFVSVLLIRDINRVRSTDFDVGIGMWIGVALALLATIVLVADLILGIQQAARDERDRDEAEPDSEAE